MHIVKMGSRDKDGERMRSNRLRRNSETTDTPPETTDRVVRTILFDGTTEWPHYDHPGGMQQIGDIVVLALEAGQGGQPSTKILFSTSATRRTRLRCPARSFRRPRRPASSASRRAAAAARARGCRARPVTT